MFRSSENLGVCEQGGPGRLDRSRHCRLPADVNTVYTCHSLLGRAATVAMWEEGWGEGKPCNCVRSKA